MASDATRRIKTSLITGIPFFALFLLLPSLFICLLCSLAGYMLFVEWPRMCGDRCSILLTLIYPSLPLVLLILHVALWRWQSPWYALYPLLAAWLVDIAAYFTGIFWGTHLCWPSVSPHKTWEGVCGGVLALACVHGVIAAMGWSVYSSLVLLAAAPVVAAGAILGDFMLSLLKRRSGVKDTGAVLPGHGGLLDRAASVFPVVVLLAIFQLVASLAGMQ